MTLPDRQIELEELILKEMDGQITPKEFSQLSDYLRQNPEALNMYLEFLTLCAGMLRPGEVTIPDDSLCTGDEIRQSALWMALAENERTAEAIYIEKSEPVTPVYNNAAIVRKQGVSKVALYTAIISTAAFLLMVAYVMTHPRKSREVVATLTGSTQAVWKEPLAISGENNRLYTNSAMHLVEGFAEITFDNQARIILQSPAQIIIEDYNQIFLRTGKLSALVPKTAIGFVVRTGAASIVDYGTEFGITADTYGQTQAHVFEGKVELRSGSDPVRFEATKKLTQGQAGRVDESGVLSSETMEAQPSSYVRSLPSKMSFGQPGKRIDLADIIGGGNGFGTGRECVGIVPTSGKLVPDLLLANRRPMSNRYSPVPAMPCIDGVFVPNGGNVPQIVSSQGHTFGECPQTDGSYWIEITNRPIASLYGNSEGEASDIHLVRLAGIQFGTRLHPAIMMHSNTGITFDLDEIRSTVPGTKIRSLTSLCGLSETMFREDAKAALWVLVDGQKRKEVNVAYSAKTYEFITIDINDSNRFLTLMVTDGENGNGGDWTFFGDPALELEQDS